MLNVLKSVITSDDIKSFIFRVVMGLLIFFVAFPILWALFGLPAIRMPDNIMLSFGQVYYFYSLVGQFIPVGFIFFCIFVILTFRVSSVVFSIIYRIIQDFKGR